MTETTLPRQEVHAPASGRLFLLELSGGRIHSIRTDGTDGKVVVSGCRKPDGIAVDVEAGHIYWTNMGDPSRDDGSIERVDLNGENRVVIVPEGVTFTPKQIHLDKTTRKLYWSDREGMRVMRANLDGSDVEILIETGSGESDRQDQARWCVGIALDLVDRKFYWTQKGGDNAGVGRILRANLDMPRDEGPADRSDVEVIFDLLPEPIDLDFDAESRTLYWTDRGDPPNGNTVNCATIDEYGATPRILVTHLMEGIGLSLDVPHGRMFFTDFGGSIYAAKLDGSDMHPILTAQGNLSGVAYVTI